MAKAKAEEKLSQALFEREEAMKTLEEERVDQAIAKKVIKNEAFARAKQEAVADIVKFGMALGVQPCSW